MNSSEQPAAPRPAWWCNFCGFKTDDPEAYLKHSCKLELKKRAWDIDTGKKQDHCS